MGLLEMIAGADSPAAKWAGQNRNWLGAVGQSIAGGFRPVDYAAASARDQQQAQEQQQKNSTLELFKRDAPDLAAAVEAGAPIGEVFGEYLRRKGPKAAPEPIKLGAGEVLYDPVTKQPIFTAPAGSQVAEPPRVETRFNPQTGLQEKVQWNPQTGQWDAFGGQQAPRGATDLSVTETKQLFETEDNILSAENAISALDQALALNEKSRSGFGSDILSSVGVNIPDWARMGNSREYDTNTLLLKNIVTEGALSQLKMIFGGMPTEGERKILLEIQGSVDQPADVRQRIYERAKELAMKRMQFNQERKAKIESGGYGQMVPADGSAPAMRGNGWTVVGVE